MVKFFYAFPHVENDPFRIEIDETQTGDDLRDKIKKKNDEKVG